MVTSASATVRPCASTLPAPSTVTRACAALPASTTLPEPERLMSSLSASISATDALPRSEEHTSELQSLMRISYAVFCLKKKKQTKNHIRLKYVLIKTQTTQT